MCACICVSVCVWSRVGHNTAEALAHIHLLTEFSTGFEMCPVIGRSLTNHQSTKTGQYLASSVSLSVCVSVSLTVSLSLCCSVCKSVCLLGMLLFKCLDLKV